MNLPAHYWPGGRCPALHANSGGIYTHVCTHTLVYIRTHAHVHVRMQTYACVHMDMRTSACTYMYARTGSPDTCRLHVHTQMRAGSSCRSGRRRRISGIGGLRSRKRQLLASARTWKKQFALPARPARPGAKPRSCAAHGAAGARPPQQTPTAPTQGWPAPASARPSAPTANARIASAGAALCGHRCAGTQA